MRSTRSSAIKRSRLINVTGMDRSSILNKVATKSESPQSSDLSSIPSDFEQEVKEEDGGTKSKYFSKSTTGKRKRGNSPPETTKIAAAAPVAAPSIKVEDVDSKTTTTPRKITGQKRAPSTPVKLKKFAPPLKWREQYDAIKELRLRVPAAVDTMGCERLAEEESASITPKIQRFQTLIALVLSSQTKDTVTSAAMKRMQTEIPGGLTLDTILDIDPKTLDEYIGKVGFHNRKTEYIKKIVVILRDQYDGDIPDTIEGLTSLPGVGPKMAYLCIASAWKKVEGIGVDTHVHRIANLLHWVPNTNTPEMTRMYLESWLPRELWHEINWLLVGFGQSVCLPRGRRCWECSIGPKATGGLGLCRAAVKVTNPSPRKVKVEIESKVGDKIATVESKVKVEDDDKEVAEVVSNVFVKDEDAVDKVVGAIPDIEDVVAGQELKAVRKRSRNSKK